MFEINLSAVKFELMEKLTNMYDEFKGTLPGIILQRTEELNEWLKKYRAVMRE